MVSFLDNVKNEVIDLYNNGYGCPAIVSMLELPVTARSVQRYLKSIGIIRPRALALEMAEERRQQTISAKWSNYVPQHKRSSVSSARRYRIMARDGFKCQICGNGLKQGAVLEIDHKIAIMNGGTNEDSNLQTICNICNNGKYWAEDVKNNPQLSQILDIE